ncbi:MAG: hypothetical protein M3N47_13695 [Chloroflexota bacterium]|nr:hypothetical protein [Chloroflexota bacterium]
MEYIGILRVLLRQRILVGLGIIGAVLVAIAINNQALPLPGPLSTETRPTSAASARLLVDARTEPSLDLESTVAETLGLRAGLLADLLTTHSAQREVARAAGVAPQDLTIIGPAMDLPPVKVPLAVAATAAALETTSAYVVRLSTDLRIPIITISASAADARSAVRVADAARRTLEAIVAGRRTRVAGLSVRSLGPINFETTVDAPNPLVGPAVALVLLAIWLGAIIVLCGLARAVRRAPRGRRRALAAGLATCVATATACAIWSVNSVNLLPPKLEPRAIQVSAAATHVLLDTQRSWILDELAGSSDITALSVHGELHANLATSRPVLEIIARRANVPIDALSARTRVTGNVPGNFLEPDSEQRAQQLLTSDTPYRLELQADQARPILNVYAQAPSTPEAIRLADATVDGLREYLRDRVRSSATADRLKQPRVEQVGGTRGGVVNGAAGPQMAIITFLVTFGITAALLFAIVRLRREWHGSRDEPPQREPRVGGDWPRTTRVLPWLIAVFMALIWLTPFNTIELAANLPFDLTLDRLVLPPIIATWLFVLAGGGALRPRVVPTAIHVTLVALVAVTCLGVVLGARYLNHVLEFDLATKKITLLVLYLVVFVLVSSTVRRREVPAFFKYTLLLAVLTALGTVWEYRFQYNVFYDLADQLLPGIFSVGEAEAGFVDRAGRSLTRGPGEHPLEAVAMMSMALPIALVGILGAQDTRRRLLYALAAAIVIAAAISTYRKSALLAPLSVCLALAYFRRRELLRLAPLGVVLVVLVQLLAPGAASAILAQVKPDQLDVGTVSDRASDYDAVRPDLWNNLLFGRGYGTYDHVSYRLLDSEILNRLVDTGIIGLLALVLMLISIVVSARRLIRARDPVWTPPALATAPAAVAFLVLCFLFDISSFPHAPYILMTLAGFLAVLIPYDRPSDGHAPPAELVEEPRRPHEGVPVMAESERFAGAGTR